MLAEMLIAGSKSCVSGGRDAPRLDAPTVEPCVLARNDHASIVFASGSMKERMLVKLALLVAGEARRQRIVYMCVCLHTGRLGVVRTVSEIFAGARQDAAVIAFLDGFAFGPALWLAYQCDLVFASPATQIGWVQCRNESDGSYNEDVTLAMTFELSRLNPDVSRQTFASLDRYAVNAEQAEALGILGPGSLSRDVFKLSRIDGSKLPEAQP